ncbi:hypothetical protein XHV734_5052 [Xanthomonas hortorum pv. vitians]|nr:hypothetical protein XHV734_5052 [Xanthomonas hortorum pv. vitians]
MVPTCMHAATQLPVEATLRQGRLLGRGGMYVGRHGCRIAASASTRCAHCPPSSPYVAIGY